MDDLLPDLTLAFNETFQMLSISTVLAIIGGLPLGFLIFVTDRHLFWQNRFVYLLSSVLVNIIRSVPFVILLVLLLPLTQFLLKYHWADCGLGPALGGGNRFYARLVDSALREVDKGIIEAAEAFGASPMRIICTVLLPEASAGLLRGLTITLVSLIGYSAMAGIVGGGGVGDTAIRFGYYRYETRVMIVTVVALIILVQVVQVLGDWLAKRADKRDRH